MAAGLDLVASYPVKHLSVSDTSLTLKSGSSLQQHSLLGSTGSIYQYVISVETFHCSPALLDYSQAGGDKGWLLISLSSHRLLLIRDGQPVRGY